MAWIECNSQIDNLRLATPPQDVGFVIRYTTKNPPVYVARITVNGSVISLGTYDNPVDARAAYLAAKRKHNLFIYD